jgi:hypothetical protein
VIQSSDGRAARIRACACCDLLVVVVDEGVVGGTSLMKVSLGDEPAPVSGVAIGACETRQRQPDREHRRHPFVPPLGITSIFQNAGSRLRKANVQMVLY